MLGLDKADGLVDTAADTISFDGRLGNFFGDNHSIALAVAGIDCMDKRHLGAADSLAVLVGVTHASAGMETVSFA